MIEIFFKCDIIFTDVDNVFKIFNYGSMRLWEKKREPYGLSFFIKNVEVTIDNTSKKWE